MSDTIRDFHAHIYFSQETLPQARMVCEAARDRFEIEMGRVHEKPVGPHPCWSCQLRVPAERFGEVVAWLCTNRDGLTVFVHPNTGDALADHTRHAIWLGQMLPLDLSGFRD